MRLEGIRSEIESRIHKIRRVDDDIYKRLEKLDGKMNNKNILRAAAEALKKGQDRETVNAILKSISF